MDNLWLETSLQDLYRNSVRAFPRTLRRQNSTDTIRVEQISFVPFKGMRTLFVKALANNDGRKNESIMLFKGVKYANEGERGSVPLMTSTGKKAFLMPLSYDDDVLVRCTCGDFHWRFNYYNSLDESLFGRKRSKYEGLGKWKANPLESAGMCKHLMKMAKILREADLIVNV